MREVEFEYTNQNSQPRHVTLAPDMTPMPMSVSEFRVSVKPESEIFFKNVIVHRHFHTFRSVTG
jgi:hypothetical protein